MCSDCLKSIEIILGSWLTTTSIMVSIWLIGFKLLSGQGFCAPGHCDLDLCLLTPTSICIIYGSWSSIIQRKVDLCEVSLKLMSGQYFANAGRTDRRKDGRHAPLHNTTDGSFGRIKGIQSQLYSVYINHMYLWAIGIGSITRKHVYQYLTSMHGSTIF